MKTVGVGVVGLGFMGRVHLEAYRAAAASGFPCRIVAVCDRSVERLDGTSSRGGNLRTPGTTARLFDPREVATTSDPNVLFADPAIDLVSICTPTDTHVELATAALRAQKHVLVEKPVALEPLAIARLAEIARDARRFCMPAMCMRFWPGWTIVLDAARDGRYGAVVSAEFQRLGSKPTWGGGFYSDLARSGGALFDLHVHDVDFVLALCGEPQAVHAVGNVNQVATTYRYAAGPRRVTAEGGWDPDPETRFRMWFRVEFERATLTFDSWLDSPLEIRRGGRSEPVDRIAGTGYDPEIRHVLECALEGRLATAVDLRDAERVTRILVAERESLERRIERILP